MPKIQAGRLTEIGQALFVAAGTPPEEAEIVMRHVVNANLAGHDLHGVIQIPTYIERIELGHIVPGAPWKIVQESPTTTVVDGHWGFGYVVNERAMRLTIEKARQSNVAAATVSRQGHIGRLASYTLMAAEAGMIGMITADFRLAQGGGAFWRKRGPARHQPDFDRDAIGSRRAALSPWQPRPPRPAKSRSRSRAAHRFQPVGSSIVTGGQPPIRASSARAAPCSRSAAPRDIKDTAYR